ncbi:Hypothetical_protein [Hexamita inflata]|uniref:Hypothetical_protein n=1 Tax=Hexamita inflata TaxID=28002 RepID=A0AA86RDZ4_9EUKA|nr:Hypothetical protein HINF_LOCUS58942 [Hexamita inflata]
MQQIRNEAIREIKAADNQMAKTKVIDFRVHKAMKEIEVKQQQAERIKQSKQSVQENKEMQNLVRQKVLEDKLKRQDKLITLKHSTSNIEDNMTPNQNKQRYEQEKAEENYRKEYAHYLKQCAEINAMNEKRKFEQQKLRSLKSVLEAEDKQQRKLVDLRKQMVSQQLEEKDKATKRMENELVRQKQLQSNLEKMQYRKILEDIKVKQGLM